MRWMKHYLAALLLGVVGCASPTPPSPTHATVVNTPIANEQQSRIHITCSSNDTLFPSVRVRVYGSNVPNLQIDGQSIPSKFTKMHDGSYASLDFTIKELLDKKAPQIPLRTGRHEIVATNQKGYEILSFSLRGKYIQHKGKEIIFDGVSEELIERYLPAIANTIDDITADFQTAVTSILIKPSQGAGHAASYKDGLVVISPEVFREFPNSEQVLREVVAHEMGHAVFDTSTSLSDALRQSCAELKKQNLLGLFKDGNFSSNPNIGHPNSPDELCASTVAIIYAGHLDKFRRQQDYQSASLGIKKMLDRPFTIVNAASQKPR